MFVIDPALFIYDENLNSFLIEEKFQKSFQTLNVFNKNKKLKEISVPLSYLDLIMNSSPMNKKGFQHYGQLSTYFNMILTMLNHNGYHSEKSGYTTYNCESEFIRDYMEGYASEIEQLLVDCFLDNTSKIVTEENLNLKPVEVYIDDFYKKLDSINFENMDDTCFPYFIPSPKHSYKTNSNRGGRDSVEISILYQKDEKACYALIKHAVIYEESKKI